MTDQQPLRQALKELLQQDSLSERELTKLQKTEQFSLSAWFGHQRRLTFASLSLIATLLLLVINFHWSGVPVDNIQSRIADEVLTNHLKIKGLDIETDSIIELQAFFDQLDFSPYLSSQIQNLGLTLVGGRYCSLQGVLAAQLRFVSVEGEAVTYYQVLYDPQRFGFIPDLAQGANPSQVRERGFTMSLWKEQEVMMVIAQNHR